MPAGGGGLPAGFPGGGGGLLAGGGGIIIIPAGGGGGMPMDAGGGGGMPMDAGGGGGGMPMDAGGGGGGMPMDAGGGGGMPMDAGGGGGGMDGGGGGGAKPWPTSWTPPCRQPPPPPPIGAPPASAGATGLLQTLLNEPLLRLRGAAGMGAGGGWRSREGWRCIGPGGGGGGPPLATPPPPPLPAAAPPDAATIPGGGVSEGRRSVAGLSSPALAMQLAIALFTLQLVSIGSASPRLTDVCRRRSRREAHAGGALYLRKYATKSASVGGGAKCAIAATKSSHPFAATAGSTGLSAPSLSIFMRSTCDERCQRLGCQQ